MVLYYYPKIIIQKCFGSIEQAAEMDGNVTLNLFKVACDTIWNEKMNNLEWGLII